MCFDKVFADGAIAAGEVESTSLACISLDFLDFRCKFSITFDPLVLPKTLQVFHIQSNFIILRISLGK